MGLMQLMPATARELGVDPFHPEDNIRGGVAYLRQLLDRYDNDVELALAAYNAGPGSVERYGAVPLPRDPELREEDHGLHRRPTGRPPAPTIYKWIETIDGRAIVRYSNTPPKGVAATPVGPALGDPPSRASLSARELRRSPAPTRTHRTYPHPPHLSAPIRTHRTYPHPPHPVGAQPHLCYPRVFSTPDREVQRRGKNAKSAIKANRQNTKRREHNRGCARSSGPG